jgi:hypothetical protein
LNTCLGTGVVNLDEIIQYRSILKEKLGVDCRVSYDSFEEAIYPIDCSVDNLKKLCVDDLPDDLDDLLFFENDLRRFAGIVDRWHLYILGENCD